MQEKKIGRFKKSWLLTKGAWRALIMDKELVVLPIIGFWMTLMVFVPAVILIILNPGQLFMKSLANESSSTPWITVLFVLVGLASAVIAAYIAGAVTHAALERFEGRDPTVKSSLAAARRRLGSLAIFTIFSYTIGYILSQIANHIPFLGGKIVAWLASAAWGVASFFAIPVIVRSPEPIGPIDATRKSVGIIKKVWGESLIVSVGVGIIAMVSFLVYFVAIAAIVILIASLPVANGWIYVSLGVIALLGLVMLALIFNLLEAFVKAAVYHYAVTGESPVHFDKAMLQQAFKPKKARKVFGV